MLSAGLGHVWRIPCFGRIQDNMPAKQAVVSEDDVDSLLQRLWQLLTYPHNNGVKPSRVLHCIYLSASCELLKGACSGNPLIAKEVVLAKCNALW